jgi:hypothetical protein
MRSCIKQTKRIVDSQNVAEDWFMHKVMFFEETTKVIDVVLNNDEKESPILALSKLNDYCNAHGVSPLSIEEYEMYKDTVWVDLVETHVPEMNEQEYAAHLAATAQQG